jgi:hypothetical protein
MDRNNLLKQDLYRSDPIAYFLIEKLNLSPLSFGLWSILISTVLYLLTASLSNTIFSTRNNVGLFKDWITWLELIVVDPIIFGYYLWSFCAIEHVIQGLESSNVLETDVSKIKQIIERFYYGKWRKFLVLFISTFFGIVIFLIYPGIQGSWASSGALPRLHYSVGTFIAGYLGGMLVLNLIANIQVLNKILKRKNLDVIPFHPDRCGGLKPLSDYSIKTAYLISIVGIYVGVIVHQLLTKGGRQYVWYIFLVIILYSVLSFGCFFGPLFTAHKGMKLAKRNLLLDISKQFQEDYSMAQSSLRDDPDILKKRTEKIKGLREFYMMTDEFPVWPFDISTLRRYLLTAPTPLLVPMLEKSIEMMLNNLF